MRKMALVASAHNGQSEPPIVEVSWENLDEMQKHLVIKDVASARMP